MFLKMICIILLLICLLEAILLFKDRGIVAEYFCKARSMLKEEGWKRTIRRSLEIISGKAVKALSFLPYKKKCNNKDLLEIAVYPTGGMGDYIISSKILDELMMYAPCRVTVFCEKVYFGQAIYGKRPDVIVKPYEGFELKKREYDLALMVEHFIHIMQMDEHRIQAIAPELLRRIDYIRNHWNELYVRIPEQCWRERIQFERCRLLNLNRWTELRMGETFEIEDQRTGISLDFDEKKTFDKIGLTNGQYITLNRGADSMQHNLEQLKVWPEEYYIALIEQIKRAFPQTQIVQLGGADCKEIPGADKRFLGTSFELTKWLIKKAQCHIDCEGGLVHLATQMSTPCIVIFGPTPIHMYGYAQNINLVNSKCNNCMGVHENWAYYCYRKLKKWCMYGVKPNEVLDAYKKIVNGLENEDKKRLVSRKEDHKLHGGRIALVNVTNTERFYQHVNENEIVIFSSLENAQKSKTECYKNGIKYRYSLAENLACNSNSFDVVIIEKYEDEEEALNEALRVTRVDGTVFLLQNNQYKEYQCVR